MRPEAFHEQLTEWMGDYAPSKAQVESLMSVLAADAGDYLVLQSLVRRKRRKAKGTMTRRLANDAYASVC